MTAQKYLLPVAFLAMILAGCNKDYNYVVPQTPVNNPPPATPISFSNDIKPIFNASCNKSGCHDGTDDPDLTSANAYTSLWSTHDYTLKMDCIDTTDIAKSALYVRVDYPASNPNFMPQGGSALSPTQIDLIANWIKQGAKDN